MATQPAPLVSENPQDLENSQGFQDGSLHGSAVDSKYKFAEKEMPSMDDITAQADGRFHCNQSRCDRSFSRKNLLRYDPRPDLNGAPLK